MPGRPDIEVGSAERLIKIVHDLKPSDYVTSGNFAFSVLDENALTNKRFIRPLYNPVDILRVRDATGKETKRLRDGHNRIYGAYLIEIGQVPFVDEEERIASNIKGLEGRDITDLVIAGNPTKYAGQTELTVAQYLDEVVDFAKKDMKEKRMAAHMISEWETQVGPEIADRFSALAALSLLGFSSLGNLTPDKISERLKSSEMPIISGELPAIRPAIITGLTEFAGVSRDKELPYADVVHAAFNLVAKELSFDALQRQVNGLFVLPPIRSKIRKGTEDQQEIENRQGILQKMIINALREDSRETSEESRAIYEVLVDPAFDYDDVIDALKVSEFSILARYANAKRLKHSQSVQPRIDRRAGRVIGRIGGGVPSGRIRTEGEQSDPLADALQVLSQSPDSFSGPQVALIRAVYHRAREILTAVDAVSSDSLVQEGTTGEASQWSERRKVIYNPQKHCTRGWFEDLVVEPLSDENRDRVTLAIEDTIRHLLPRSYRTVLSLIEDANGNHGLDVITNSLSPRLARLVHEVSWGKELPEFQYLAAMHVVRMLTVRTEKGHASEALPHIMLLTQKIQEEILPRFHIKGSDGYPQLLEFALYADDSSAFSTAQLALKSRSFYDAHSARSLAEKFVGNDWRWSTADRETSRATVLAALDRYFNQTILGPGK